MTRPLNLLLLGLFAAPIVGSAQSGTIEFDRAVRYSFEVPEQFKNSEMFANMPKAAVTSMVLSFNPTAARLMSAPKEEKPAELRGDHRVEMMVRMKMGSVSRRDQETMLDGYADLEGGTYTEVKEFMTRTFRVTQNRPRFSWKLSGEQGKHLGMVVQKATAEHDGDTIEAWFTTEIPIAAGPAQFGGLPGMILALTVNEDELIYSATAVNLDTPTAASSIRTIEPPTAGKEVTPEEYEATVAEKLEELQNARKRRGGDRVMEIRHNK